MADPTRVLIADKFEASGVAGLEKLGCVVTQDAGLAPETIPAALAASNADVLIVRSTKVPGAVFESATNLKGVIRAGSGFDNIDFAAAGTRGVHVCNTPGMNAVAVAELAMGHLISLDRRLPEQDAELKTGHWFKKEFSKAKGLKGRKLLVIGTGNIGRELIARAQAFGMIVSAQDIVLTQELADELGVTMVPFGREPLLAALPGFDAVSIHVPALPETKGMCDAAFFGAMMDGAYFVNTSRGPLVNEPDLIAAVQTKNIRAGLDVYCDQPGSKDCPFTPAIAKVPGVHCTHHVGASTDQAQTAVGDETVRIVEVWQGSGKWIHCINEQHLSAATA